MRVFVIISAKTTKTRVPKDDGRFEDVSENTFVYRVGLVAHRNTPLEISS